MTHEPRGIAPLDEAMAALQAVLIARRLYGADHAAAREPATRAADLLGRALGDQPAVDVMLIEDRLVSAGRVLATSGTLAEHLLPRLRAGRIASLTVTRGVCGEEVGAFAAQLESEGACPGTAHIRPGGLAVAVARSQAPASSPSELPTAEVEAMLASAMAGRDVDQRTLEGVIGAICAAVAVGRGTILPLAGVRNHDEYTYLHTVNVGVLAAALAEAVGLGPHTVRDITAAALLHDIGKQAVPVEILTKKGGLTPEERARVMRHPVDGAKILFETPGVPDLARIVAYEHHMLLDGTGYPNRRRGRPIHLASRIVQLADVYDALRTHRPYRPAMTPEQVRDTLLKGSGKQYEADLLAEFLRTVDVRARGTAPGPEDTARAA